MSISRKCCGIRASNLEREINALKNGAITRLLRVLRATRLFTFALVPAIFARGTSHSLSPVPFWARSGSPRDALAARRRRGAGEIDLKKFRTLPRASPRRPNTLRAVAAARAKKKKKEKKKSSESCKVIISSAGWTLHTSALAADFSALPSFFFSLINRTILRDTRCKKKPHREIEIFF